MAKSFRFLVWCSVIVILFVILPLAAVLNLPADGKRGPFWDKYQQVQIDMTQAQVEALLGPPADEICLGFGHHRFGWLDNGQQITVSYSYAGNRGIVVSKSFLLKPKQRWPLWNREAASDEWELLDQFPPE